MEHCVMGLIPCWTRLIFTVNLDDLLATPSSFGCRTRCTEPSGRCKESCCQGVSAIGEDESSWQSQSWDCGLPHERGL